MRQYTAAELDKVWYNLIPSEKDNFLTVFSPLDLDAGLDGQPRYDLIASIHIQLGQMPGEIHPTDAGAEEYEEAMRGEDLMYGR